MKRFPKLEKTNLKSLKRLKNKKSKILKEKKIISFSSNKRNISLKHKSQEKILSTVKKYLVNENQDKLKEIL